MAEENNVEKGAIVQRDMQTFAIVPRIPAGIVDVEYLEKIIAAVKKFNIQKIKIVSGQRIALIGIQENDIDRVWKFLGVDKGDAIGLCFYYVQACPGTDYCKFGVQDSTSLALEIDKKYYGTEMPAKLKFGISGCPYCCAESFTRDIGIIGKKTGWTVTIGGNAGASARVGDVLAIKLSKEDMLELVDSFIQYYRANANKKERTAKFVKRVGVEKIKAELNLI